jgi:arginyl-tRNA synthetase
MKNLPQSEMIESCSVAGPGFVNVVLSKNWMAKVFGNCPIFVLFSMLYIL